MWDMLIYDSKNINLEDCLLQIEKVALFTNRKEYELATAKSTTTPYKMVKRMGEARSWSDIK